jgi:two-component system, LuxR family, response regulator FixJ
MTGSTVFVIEDDKAVRDSLCWVIDTAGLRAEAYGSAGAFLDVCDGGRPGCLVLDVRLPDMSGLQLQQQLQSRGVLLPTLIITGYGDVRSAVQAMKAGALDYIEKPFSDQVLLQRVRMALRHDHDRREQERQRRQVAQRMDNLTQRERQIMAMVIAGRRNRHMAEHLKVSIKTVEAHRARMMSKMGARSGIDLVRLVLMTQQG